MKLKNLTLSFAALFAWGSAVTLVQAKAPGMHPVVVCDQAAVSMGNGPSQFQTVYLRDVGAIDYLLTENTSQIINRDYLVGPNASMGVSPSIDLNDIANLDLVNQIVRANGIQTQTNDPVRADGSNYTGSLSIRPNGKQVRVVLDRSRGELSVTLFDTTKNLEDANWVFRGCR